MSFYIRVLSTSADCIARSALTQKLKSLRLRATLSGDTSATGVWEELVLSHSDGREIAQISRHVVVPGSLGSEELSEFASEISDCKPANAATWLRKYFTGVRCIYAFKVLRGTDHKNGWKILGAIKDAIWSFAPSIIQADSEGFSNEDGYHVLWQFSESVEGNWWMGILEDGRWRHFQMDLGCQEQREAFLSGHVPKDAKLA